ncbi:MAG: protein kinase, partial [Alphaproteobacteria bacterium]|nr:protein kinase [Alphaproteobacteria bacterium]
MERAEDLPTFGPYQAIDVLGSGGMGVVWRARHRDTGELVALKTSQPRTEALRAIDAEIRVLRRLRHPGVVRVVDSGEQDGMPWMAMAYVEGTPLRALFDTTTRSSSSTLAFDGLEEPTGTDTGEGAVTGLPVEEVASLFVRVCTVLAWLHGEGVVHADLKPENILIAPDGRPVLVDFGLLRAGGARAEVLDGRSRTMGTLHYLAPEAGQRPLDARADLYAVGCMIFELVAGMPPFRGSPGEVLRARREEAAPRLSEHVPDVPPRLDRLVASLLATEPEDRPAYATDVVAALLSCGGRPEPDVGPEPRAYLYRSRLLERDEARQRVTGLAPAVLVVGEAGSGRTRLLQEAETRAGRVLSSLTGRAVDGRDLTRQLVRGVFNLAPSAEIAASWFGPDADLLGPLDPAVAALVGARPPRRFVSRAVEEEQTALALARVVVAAGPLRVVVDDLDEADGVAVSALVGLARRAAEGVGGIQLRVAARTGAAVVERLAEVGAEVVALAPLSDAALHQLIADRLAVRTAPPDLRELVAERAEGSPLVAGELLHLLLDRGLLVRRGDAWRLSGDTASFVAGIADGDAIAARRLESLDA